MRRGEGEERKIRGEVGVGFHLMQRIAWNQVVDCIGNIVDNIGTVDIDHMRRVVDNILVVIVVSNSLVYPSLDWMKEGTRAEEEEEEEVGCL